MRNLKYYIGLIKYAVGVFLRFVFSITGLIFICVFIRSFVGLGLKFFELFTGNKDYSDWLIMSAAEEPVTELFILLILSIIVVPLCFFVCDFAKNKLEKGR